MNPKINSNDRLKFWSLGIAGLVAVGGMFVMGYCTMFKIYIDVPMLLVLSNIVTGIVSCVTTVLVGRTISQLNQQSDVTNKPLVDNTQTEPEPESKP